MLNEQPWIVYANDLYHEWKHAFDEGKEVEQFQEECNNVANLPKDDPNRDALADKLFNKLHGAPVKNSFTFVEPSDLPEIQLERPTLRPKIQFDISKNALNEKVYGAWLGRIAGCLLGKPVEGYHIERLYKLLKATDNYPLKKYIAYDVPENLKNEIQMWEKAAWIDLIDGKAPVDDDTNYTVLGLKIIENYGKNFTPADVAEAWLSWVPLLATCTAERVAYKNLAQGLQPPASATYKNPFREWIGAQIRADFFGYVNPGNPELAADMAWRDASISHVKNGIYGEMFVAAMLAAAAVSDDIMTVLQAGLGEIPNNCRLTEKVNLMISWFESGVSQADAMRKIHEIYNEKEGHDWCHTISNAMIVVFGLLYGNKDFGHSICISVEAGFDTDCNGATVGSIIGMMIGAKNIPSYWTQPFNNLLLTTVEGYNLADISMLTEKTLELIEK